MKHSFIPALTILLLLTFDLYSSEPFKSSLSNISNAKQFQQTGNYSLKYEPFNDTDEENPEEIVNDDKNNNDSSDVFLTFASFGGTIGVFAGNIQSQTFDITPELWLSIYEHHVGLFIGYTQFENETHFDGIPNLHVNSYSIFLGGYYAINDNFFAGVKVGSSINRVDDRSQDYYSMHRDRDPPVNSTGRIYASMLGANIDLFDFLSLRLKGTLGINNYKMTTGSSYFDSTYRRTTENYTEEYKLQLYAAASAGLFLKFNFQ